MASVARCRLESAESNVEKAITDTFCLSEAIILTTCVAKQCTQNNRCSDATYLQSVGEYRTMRTLYDLIMESMYKQCRRQKLCILNVMSYVLRGLQSAPGSTLQSIMIPFRAISTSNCAIHKLILKEEMFDNISTCTPRLRSQNNDCKRTSFNWLQRMTPHPPPPPVSLRVAAAQQCTCEISSQPRTRQGLKLNRHSDYCRIPLDLSLKKPLWCF